MRVEMEFGRIGQRSLVCLKMVSWFIIIICLFQNDSCLQFGLTALKKHKIHNLLFSLDLEFPTCKFKSKMLGTRIYDSFFFCRIRQLIFSSKVFIVFCKVAVLETSQRLLSLSNYFFLSINNFSLVS